MYSYITIIFSSSSTAGGNHNNTYERIKKSRHDARTNAGENDNHKNPEHDWLIKKCYQNVTPIQWNNMGTSSSKHPTNNHDNDTYRSSIATSSIFSGHNSYNWSKNSWQKTDQSKVIVQSNVDFKGTLMITYNNMNDIYVLDDIWNCSLVKLRALIHIIS